LRYAAQHADIWHGFGDADTIAHKCEVLDGWCAEVGRDPAEVTRSVQVERPPDDVADGLVMAGVGLVAISATGPRYNLGLLRDWLAWRDDHRTQPYELVAGRKDVPIPHLSSGLGAEISVMRRSTATVRPRRLRPPWRRLRDA
jgi:hypothetical protein